ncbi:MAG: dTMP kinase [Actinobacteria bacterium]|jgi:dTMP kinase|nr:dTMP kinase [Actinomycetota bacterium]
MGQVDNGASAPADGSPGGVSPRVYAALFKNRDFRNLGLSTFASALGDWIGFLAILTLTEDILGTTRAAAFAVSAVMAARVLPSMLLGPVAGVFVDRWDRKRLMIACDVGRGVVMALIPFSNEILTLLLATLVIEVMSSLFGPAKDAVFPTLVPRSQLVVANQLNLMVTYGTLPLAGVLFATLMGLAGPLSGVIPYLAERPVALPIWFNAVSFLASAPLIARLHAPAPAGRAGGTTGPSAWEELREGFAFIGRHPIIRALIVGIMVASAAAGAVISTGQFFARVLRSGSSGFGILVAVVGIGLVIGLVASAGLTTRVAPERLFAPGIGIAGGALVVAALMPTLPLAAGPAMIMGVGAGVSFIVGYTILQSRADDRIRGRTFGAMNSGVRFSIFASTTAAPFLIGVIGRERAFEGYTIGGVRITLMAAGLLALGGAVLTGRSLHRAFAAHPELDRPLTEQAVASRDPGLFVVFEGGDGTGKSTQIRLLRAAVEGEGRDVLVTREPGGTPIAEHVREILLSRDSDAMADRTEALLYAASRAQHVEEVIRPALEHGSVVLCDRFIDSSIVYQGAGRGLGEEAVERLNEWATGGLAADLVVLLDLDADESLQRVEGEPDRLEAAGLPFHRTVAKAYRRRAEKDPSRYLVLDARLPVDALHERIRQAVLARLEPATAGQVAQPTDAGEVGA